MRRGIYGVIGVSIGLILYIFMYVNTPEMKELNIINYQKPDYNEQDLREVRGGVTDFLEYGSYHINTMEYDAYQSRGVVKYGKDNPMFHYIHQPPAPEPEPEETEEFEFDEVYNFANCEELTSVFPQGVSQTHPAYKSLLDRDNDGHACEPGGDLGVGSSALINFITGEKTMGFNTETRSFEEKDIAFQLYDFDLTGKLPVDIEHYNMTSAFGSRKDPFTQKDAFHSGLDLASVDIEGANVYSISHGKVVEVHKLDDGEKDNGYGNYVVVEHNNYKSLYAHLSSVSDIKVGNYVPAGFVLGKVGNTGRSTGPHLHFEVIVDDSVTVDPALFLNRIRKVD